MAAFMVFIREKTLDQPELETYWAKIRATLEGRPIKILAAYGRHVTLEGPEVEGVVVAEFPTLEEARDVFEVRRGLERLVAENLAGRLTTSQAAELERHVQQEEKAHGRDGPESIRLAGEFHIRLAEMTGNALLRRYVQEVSSRCSLILAIGIPSVAMGFGSVATAANTFSVGAVGAERTVVNVAPGLLSATSSDAINGSQLYATNQQVATNSTNIATAMSNVSPRICRMIGCTSSTIAMQWSFVFMRTNLGPRRQAINYSCRRICYDLG